MIMAEDKGIHLMILLKLGSKLIKRLLLTLEDIFFMAGEPVFLCPAITETVCDPWMQQTEQELKHPIMEDPTQETISERCRPKTVSMTQTEDLSTYLDQCRLFQALHPKFLEITVSPHVVVSLEEIYIDATINEISNSAEYSHVTLRYYITVLVPEIPDISKKIQRCRILRQRLQEVHKTRLSGSRIINLQPQMNVRYEICEISIH